jgi:hypothetical protein
MRACAMHADHEILLVPSAQNARAVRINHAEEILQARRAF